MGGYGSGRTGGKPIAEHCRQIDICRMRKDGSMRDGEITSGTLHWSCFGRPSGSINFRCDLIDPNNARINLFFSLERHGRTELVEQVILLRFTVPHYGGRRWWMICPLKHARVAKLYMPMTADCFASRKAWRLGYRSQRIAPADQPLERLFRLEDKLGIGRGSNGPLVRPKGMWERTFVHHQAEHDELSRQVVESMIAQTPQLAEHLGNLV